jgi:hypothetical protein
MFALTVFWLGAAVAAADPAQPSTTAPPSQAPITVKGQRDPEDKVVCHVSMPTGSFIPVRTCKSIRQKEAEREKGLAYREKILEEEETRRQYIELMQNSPR